MRKLLSILFALISFTSFGQTTRVLAGYDAATLRPGTIYRDTLISLPYTAGKYITGYGTVGSLPDTTRGYFSGTTNRIAYNITTGVFDIGSDVVTLLGTQTLTNKTLISPIFNTSSTSGYVWTATNTTGAGGWAAAAGGGGSSVEPLFQSYFTTPQDYINNNLWYIENYGGGTFAPGQDTAKIACALFSTGGALSGGTHIQTRVGGTYNLTPINIKAEKITLQWDLKMSALPVIGQDFKINVGFSDAGINYIYFQNTASGFWELVSATASGGAAVSTSGTLDLLWHTYKIVIDAANNNISAYRDGLLIGTLIDMTKVPYFGMLEFNINKISGTTDVNMKIANVRIFR
jgi:hypothetical protein